MTALLWCASLAMVACGSGQHSSDPPSNAPLSGNWVITLTRLANPKPVTYTGFLLQTGNSITGSFIFSGGTCKGVGPVTGSLNGQNLQLVIDVFGQDITLTGIFSSNNNSGLFVGGAFSMLNGGCGEGVTGTWAGVQVAPLTGSFHGTLVSTAGNDTVSVSGQLTQGPNMGASNASLSGNVSTTGTPPFCSYVSSATITGIISGTAVDLFFYGPDGSQLNLLPLQTTVSTDGSSLSGQYNFQGISKTCTGDIGTLQVSFP